MYSKPINILVYGLAALALASPLVMGGHPLVVLVISGVFVVYDTLFVRLRQNLAERSADFTLEQVMKVRGLMANLLGIYSILLGFFFVADPAEQGAAVELLKRANVTGWMIVLPLVLAGTLMLYVPVVLTSRDASGEPESLSEPGRCSPALKTLLWVIILSEKIAVFVTVYVLVAIMATAGRSFGLS